MANTLLFCMHYRSRKESSLTKRENGSRCSTKRCVSISKYTLSPANVLNILNYRRLFLSNLGQGDDLRLKQVSRYSPDDIRPIATSPTTNGASPISNGQHTPTQSPVSPVERPHEKKSIFTQNKIRAERYTIERSSNWKAVEFSIDHYAKPILIDGHNIVIATGDMNENVCCLRLLCRMFPTVYLNMLPDTDYSSGTPVSLPFPSHRFTNWTLTTMSWKSCSNIPPNCVHSKCPLRWTTISSSCTVTARITIQSRMYWWSSTWKQGNWSHIPRTSKMSVPFRWLRVWAANSIWLAVVSTVFTSLGTTSTSDSTNNHSDLKWYFKFLCFCGMILWNDDSAEITSVVIRVLNQCDNVTMWQIHGHGVITLESKKQILVLGGNDSHLWGGYLGSIWFVPTFFCSLHILSLCLL